MLLSQETVRKLPRWAKYLLYKFSVRYFTPKTMWGLFGPYSFGQVRDIQEKPANYNYYRPIVAWTLWGKIIWIEIE